MPPKPKFTKEEIVAVAKEIVRQNGAAALTAREVAAKLGSSPRPIFTVFKNMKELQSAVNDSVINEFNARLHKAESYTPAFKEIGMQMIRFANEEPNFFKLLYIQNEQPKNFDGIFGHLGEMEKVCIEIIMRDYHLEEKEAELLFKNVWLQCYGIASLCASGITTFSEDDILKITGTQFMALMMFIKSGKSDIPTIKPVPDKDSEESNE